MYFPPPRQMVLSHPDEFGDSPREMVLERIQQQLEHAERAHSRQLSEGHQRTSQQERVRRKRAKDKARRAEAAVRRAAARQAQVVDDPPVRQSGASKAAVACAAPDRTSGAAKQVHITVQTMSGKVVLNATLFSTDNVYYLKEQLRSEAGFPLCRQQVLNNATILEDSCRLGELEVGDNDGASVNLMVIVSGEPVGSYCVFCDGIGKAAFGLSCVWCRGTGHSKDKGTASKSLSGVREGETTPETKSRSYRI